jgi:hypothetical protein
MGEGRDNRSSFKMADESVAYSRPITGLRSASLRREAIRPSVETGNVQNTAN